MELFLTIGDDLWNILGLPLMGMAGLAFAVHVFRRQLEMTQTKQPAVTARAMRGASNHGG